MRRMRDWAPLTAQQPPVSIAESILLVKVALSAHRIEVSLRTTRPLSGGWTHPSRAPSRAMSTWDVDAGEGVCRLRGTQFVLPRKLYDALFPYQRDAVAWAFSLTRYAPPAVAVQPPRVSHGALARLSGDGPGGKGGILADE